MQFEQQSNGLTSSFSRYFNWSTMNIQKRLPIRGSKIELHFRITRRKHRTFNVYLDTKKIDIYQTTSKSNPARFSSQRRIKKSGPFPSSDPLSRSTADQFQEGISKISDLAGVKSLAFRTIIVESVECNADTRKRRRYLGFLGFCARSKSFGSNLQFLTRDGRGR